MDTSSDKLIRLHARKPRDMIKNEFQLIVPENYGIRTNHIKMRF